MRFSEFARKIAAHNAFWADLPLMPPVQGALKAEFDGENAELRDLGQELFEAIETIGLLNPKGLPLEFLAHESVEAQLDRPGPWPLDRARNLLDAWTFHRSLDETKEEAA